MDRSGSNNQPTSIQITPPPRRFTVEFLVGFFAMAGVAAAGALSVGLAGQTFFGGGRTEIIARFDNISGLKKGASVEIAGVPIGEVSRIQLEDPDALVTLSLFPGFSLRDDDTAAIRTKGIIGDRYVKISRGGSTTNVASGGKLPEPGESVVDIEDLIGKIIHTFTSSKSEEK